MKSLRILPLGNISEEILKLATNVLIKTYSLKVETTTGIDIPKGCYNSSRSQYLAEKILEVMKRKFEDGVFGICNVDLYAEGLNFIFGQAELSGRVAIISTCRLNPEFYGLRFNKKLFFERIEKESIHEIGHMLGLTHCNDKSCVMSFSNSILEVDRKSKKLCEKCKLNLKVLSI